MNAAKPRRHRDGPLYLCALLLAAAFLISALAGCKVNPETVAQFKQARDAIVSGAEQAKAEIAKARADKRTIEAELALLEPNDPLRAPLERALQLMDSGLTKSEKALAELDKRRPLADAALRSAERGEIDPNLAGELSKLPVVGPYANLALILGGIGYGIWNRRYKKIGEQLVKSVDEVLPEPTESQKLALAKHQDESTKAFVASAKKGS